MEQCKQMILDEVSDDIDVLGGMLGCKRPRHRVSEGGIEFRHKAEKDINPT